MKTNAHNCIKIRSTQLLRRKQKQKKMLPYKLSEISLKLIFNQLFAICSHFKQLAFLSQSTMEVSPQILSFKSYTEQRDINIAKKITYFTRRRFCPKYSKPTFQTPVQTGYLSYLKEHRTLSDHFVSGSRKERLGNGTSSR